MNKQLESFSFSAPTNLLAEEKWLLAVSPFQSTNSVFDITDENKGFSISIIGRWRFLDYLKDEIIDKLRNLLKFRSQNVIELQLEEVRKKSDKKNKIQGNFLIRF